MMRKNNNQNRNMKHRGGQGGGQRRYSNNGNGGGGNRGNDSQNIQRQKHHATQMLGKYSDMARNAQMSGDRVDVEYYLQHVDHYTRVLTDITAIEAERFAHQREQQIIPGGPNDPNAQQHSNEAQASNENSNEQNEAPSSNQGSNNDSAPSDNSAEFNNNTQRQPRMTRNRRPNHSDNGAAEANSNKTDIPLPDSILPPI